MKSNADFRIAFVCSGYENLGVEYLSASLKKEGFSAKLFLDPILFAESGFINQVLLGAVFSFREKLLKKIIDYRPGLICFSVITDNYSWAWGWAKELKKYLDAKIILGGMHPTSVPEKVIVNPYIDYVCVGEGDYAIVELAKFVSGNGPLSNMTNVWLKLNGEVINTQLRPLINNLDTLPFPDKDLFYDSAPIFNSGYTIVTSRGCLYSCSYCCNNVLKEVYKNESSFLRKRSPENVIAELKIAKLRYKPKYIAFLDEIFNSDGNWLNIFLDRYLDEIKLPFSCYLFPDLVTETTSRLLKESGCVRVQMGVQIENDEKRRSILNRPSSKESISKAILLLRKKKIFVVCDNIFGLPDEKEDDLVNLCLFYRNYQPNRAEIFWLRYYPKTKITEWSRSNDYINDKKLNEICDGRLSGGITKIGEHKALYAKKIMLLFYVSKFLPRFILDFILDKRLYRSLPGFDPIFLCIIDRVFNRAKIDINTTRTVKRYVYFISKKIFG